MEQGYFITGTDTNVGKTWASVGLMRYFKAQGKSVIGLKPVASGCFAKNSKLYNQDALLLLENASVKLDYDLINPYAYELPVSPHIAGKNHQADFKVVKSIFEQVKNQAQVVIVEGAGGWHSPINDNQDNSDLAEALNLPVIMVVGIKLGCINHAKLTHDAIKNKGLNCAGWIAMCVDNLQIYPELSVHSIKDKLSAPLLAEMPYLEIAEFEKLTESLFMQRFL